MIMLNNLIKWWVIVRDCMTLLSKTGWHSDAALQLLPEVEMTTIFYSRYKVVA